MEDYRPIFDIVVDDDLEDSGFIRNSFVDSPAVNVDYFAFSKEKKKLDFSKNEKEQVFTSVSILANTPILRQTDNGEEYYVVFSKDVIRKIRNKLFKQNKQNEVTLYHDDGKKLEGVYMVESLILNKERFDSPLFDVPDGSLVTSYWVEDKEQYNKLLNDKEFNGFSIELNASITNIFNKQFDAMYKEDKVVQKIKDITFSDMSDKEKEKKIEALIKQVS